MPELETKLRDGLRGMEEKLDRLLASAGTVERRLERIEAAMGRVEVAVAQLHVTLAEQSLRLDRSSATLTRIEQGVEAIDTLPNAVAALVRDAIDR